MTTLCVGMNGFPIWLDMPKEIFPRLQQNVNIRKRIDLLGYIVELNEVM
jgi:hypothetical protein